MLKCFFDVFTPSLFGFTMRETEKVFWLINMSV